ncbi:hypothetical protein ACH4UM_40645 [Streptomyces sp. NPDC020801]|uniref:hypothetical protein n=1 Tax=unclassified Streptomyces TaxID=2593676 RepID=UPI0037B7E3E0
MTEREPREKSFLEKAAYIVTPGSVVFALLYYFGYIYRNAYYAYFGLSASELEFSSQDYLLGSPAAIFLPLWVLLALGIAGVIFFRALERRFSQPGMAAERGMASRVFAVGGIALLLLSFPVFLEPVWWQRTITVLLPVGWLRVILPAFLVAVGGLLLLFAMYLSRGPRGRGGRFWGITEGLLVCATALIVFFALARYAHGAGTSAARADARTSFSGMPRVLIHSRQRISPTVSSVRCKDQGAAYLPYRYMCVGFRVLAKSRSRYYLVPSEPLPNLDVTLLLDDNDTIRVEVRGER